MEFESERISEHIYKIKTFLNVYCYLIVGNDKACLIDTGYGVGDLKEFIKSITDKELIVLLSHGHSDHACGAGLFDEVHLNKNDIPLYKKEYDVEKRLIVFRRSTFPVRIEDINPFYEREFPPINDKDIFDLGGLHIEAISVPGHTAGTMMFLIREDRVMFYGDGCTKHTYLFLDGSLSVETYLNSLIMLKLYDDAYDVVIRSHNSYMQPKSILDENIRLCKLILNGKDAHLKKEVMGHIVFSAVEEDENGIRFDGKEGNIYYL